jgi:hypothetical protein
MKFKDPLAAMREPSTIRARCAAVTRAVEQGRSGHFKLDRSALPALAQRVAALTRERFPDLKIPYHSRWRHVEAGGVDRKGELDVLLAGRTPAAVARARIDLTVVSVLLDAGAGPQWRDTERPELDALALPVHRQKGEDLLAMLGAATGASKTKDPAEVAAEDSAKDAAEGATADAPDAGAQTATPADTAAQETAPGQPGQSGQPEPRERREQNERPEKPERPERASFTRSEGLGVASFRAFVAGVFSSDPADPLRVDALADAPAFAAALGAVLDVLERGGDATAVVVQARRVLGNVSRTRATVWSGGVTP